MSNEEDIEQLPVPDENEAKKELHHIVYLSSMYQNWFLDYASYVILERAVPYVNDGLKPVQRRILHAMRQMDDGRYTKVANIIGQTMMYHPHGDASIGDALVQLGQKDLLIDGTERRTQRSSHAKNQRKQYSGKQGCHTRKNLVMANPEKRVSC